MKEGAWQSTVGTGLHGKTLGIYGFDLVGGIVASVGKAFGMQVICWEGPESQGKAREAGLAEPASRDDFFESADVVSLHIALTKQTRGIITAADFALHEADRADRQRHARTTDCGRCAGRGAKAWPAGLCRGRVYEEEPVIGGSHPLLQLPNAVCTPHLGNVEQAILEKLYSGAIDGILGVASGKPVNVFNPETIQKP